MSQAFEVDANRITDEESWVSIHATVDDARRSMYVAGSTTILLLWAAITGTGLVAQYAIAQLAPGFTERFPWFPGPLWGALAVFGMVACAIIGNRASQILGAGEAARSAGIRVFLFWLAVVGAAFLIPLAAGSWNADVADRGRSIVVVTVGIVALGHILFGIMHRPLIAAAGIGYALAFYIPFYVAGDAAPAISGAALLIVATAALIWVTKNRVSG
ncbi:MAG: hypothetical protein OXB92_10795 [Acidimicrobiaceae bacterium]|nr:hypothetical protein [Acidimicrobiia bacterium]MCY4494331.1 hypothetical protein [Acidimicrobiaceae bacterium]